MGARDTGLAADSWDIRARLAVQLGTYDPLGTSKQGDAEVLAVQAPLLFLSSESIRGESVCSKGKYGGEACGKVASYVGWFSVDR